MPIKTPSNSSQAPQREFSYQLKNLVYRIRVISRSLARNGDTYVFSFATGHRLDKRGGRSVSERNYEIHSPGKKVSPRWRDSNLNPEVSHATCVSKLPFVYFSVPFKHVSQCLKLKYRICVVCKGGCCNNDTLGERQKCHYN